MEHRRPARRPGSRWRSTTSAPATRRCRACSSSSFDVVKLDRRHARRGPRRPARRSRSLRAVVDLASACAPTSSPRASRPRTSSSSWSPPASTTRRASSSGMPLRAEELTPLLRRHLVRRRAARGRQPARRDHRRAAPPAVDGGPVLLASCLAWPSPSRSSLTLARRSAARSTRSRRRPTTRARSATAPGFRTGCARSAVATGAARSSPSTGQQTGLAPLTRWSPSPLTRAGRIWAPPRSPPEPPSPPRRGSACSCSALPARSAPVPAGRRGRRRPGVDRQGRRSGVRGPLDARGLDRPGREGGRRRPRPGARVRRLDRLGARRRAVQHAPRPRDLPPGAGAAGAACRAAAPVLLLDVGANVTCRPEHLVQFAHMGSAFAVRR